MKKAPVTKNIMDYMNSMSIKQYNYYQVVNIARAIKAEYRDRRNNKIAINVKTDKGKDQLNQRTAAIVNEKMGGNYILPEDVRLFKRCFVEEYTNRTGKCAWGFKDVRKRLGFDEETGIEIV